MCVSTTEEAFEIAWSQLQRDSEQYPSTLTYISSTWLTNKEKSVDSWVGKTMHFGCVTTSRAESSNSFLKSFLSSSVGDLLAVFQECHLAMEHLVHKLKKEPTNNKLKRSGFASDPLYDLVLLKISNYALREVNQHKTAHTGSTYTSFFLTTMGLPRAHVMCVRASSIEPMRLSDIRYCWHLDRVSLRLTSDSMDAELRLNNVILGLQQAYQEASPHRQVEIVQTIKDVVSFGSRSRLQDPTVARRKGRPIGAGNKYARRNPSGFEYAERTRK